jgi:alanyl-tRNA synthetase
VKLTNILDELSLSRKQVAALRQNQASVEFSQQLQHTKLVKGVSVLATRLNEADADTLRQMVDRFRQHYFSKGIVVLGSSIDNRPIVIAAVTEDLVTQGLNAVDLVKFVAAPLGGGGGGKPTLAQAGGKDASKLDVALKGVEDWVNERLNE